MTEIPATLEEALAQPAPKPAHPGPTLVAVLALWSAAIWAVHAVATHDPAYNPAPARPAPLRDRGALSAGDALALTDEVVSALAADQLQSVLLKIRLAEKVARRLTAPDPASSRAAR